jgi:transposase
MKQALAVASIYSPQTQPREVIGIDLGDRWSRFCVLDQVGTVIQEDRVRTTPEAFTVKFGNVPLTRIVMEVGAHSPWVSRLLQTQGHEVIVANPRKVRLIYESNSKNDRLDARMLARLGRVDVNLLSPVQHRSSDVQADLAVVRSRDALVKARTQLINAVRGMVKSMGGRLPRSTTGVFAEKASATIPAELKPALEPLVRSIRSLSQQIRHYDEHVENLADKRYPETKLLRQVKGVGPLIALTYVLTIEDPARFQRSRQVGSFLGLRPKQSESGNSAPQLGISKCGSGHLRWLLVQSAHYTLSRLAPDSRLRRWGLALASRGGKNGKRRAVVAVARKLAVLLHHLWQTGEVYEPLYESGSQAA